MSVKAISEFDAKRLVWNNIDLPCVANKNLAIAVNPATDFSALRASHSWAQDSSLVAKPDQLIKRRGKLGLVKVKCSLDEAAGWIAEKQKEPFTIGNTSGKLKNFIIEPFVAHEEKDEMYILFHHEGGVDIGDVDDKAVSLDVDVDQAIEKAEVEEKLLGGVKDSAQKSLVAEFIVGLFSVYRKLYFAYMEINPIVVRDGKVFILDLAAKLDQCAEYICSREWGSITFPPPFGRDAFPEEKYIAELDAKSGSSMKLTILNPKGNIWTMVAGGGASVIYSDTICELGGTSELANYGEYSGAPSEQQTYDYARTILSLLTRHPHPDGKKLIIGGGIANFTNVAATFKGIVRALKEYQLQLQEHKTQIFVRRGGPNYQEGLRVMKELGDTLGVPLHVFGPETHMTAVVAMALGQRATTTASRSNQSRASTTANFLLSTSSSNVLGSGAAGSGAQTPQSRSRAGTDQEERKAEASKDLLKTAVSKAQSLFTKDTQAIIWGLQNRAVQGMLDFDFVCRRKKPSVVASVYPFVGDHNQKFYWGHKEILIPVYKNMSDAIAAFPKADVVINFASLRSAEEATKDILKYPQIRTIATIAEGIPENKTKLLNKMAKERGVTIIGPATVGGIKPGCFKIGNTGGMLDNILDSKLYRPGSVAYVSRSGGMSNELNNIISRATNGVFEGCAIGGDRYPGSTFLDHLIRYHNEPKVQLLVLLGEIGGLEEYEIIKAKENGLITKPVVAWCIGTCAKLFGSDVQFGHAGASANANAETAVAKNEALREAGFCVPTSFDGLGDAIKETYQKLVEEEIIVEEEEVPPPTVPMDYNWARELGLIRKPASFMSSVSDERGQELSYAGVPISKVFESDMGIGGVLSLLWFQKRLPPYAAKFLEMCLMVTADHGPAVSGAHNTIVCARAGKDLVSSLTSGLLTIVSR
ncbi:Oidioi.mRNA.OKI2018_I69.chr2.g5550.t1.cds [Oikopleura dioica]|uniref:ATP-citrate synthase n=1 Tax=Oikopleura dioica TaxID=34765 RepID=A0ABN7T491_OIKDI|nr:Oidioi.mRNA.OKI2018_I69.chr2.g5550.t1.cds [Oikopleura dioica]